MPHSQKLMEKYAKPEDREGLPPFKHTDAVPGSRRHIALFSSFDAELPIKRVIVGPSRDQEKHVEFALGLVAGKVPVFASETPFIG
jgi:hypothetical protein